MEFSLNNKKGFVSFDRKLRIFDSNGKPFYFRDSDKKHTFNLPKGNYVTLNNITPQEKPFKLRKLRLPRRERKRHVPSNYRFVYKENPNKCTVLIPKEPNQECIIILDNSLKDLPRHFLTFILFHEQGHLFYTTEKYCDMYAFNKMIDKGFNVSQIVQASKLSLTDKNKERKDFTHSQGLKTKII